jgi:hypothetical protein
MEARTSLRISNPIERVNYALPNSGVIIGGHIDKLLNRRPAEPSEFTRNQRADVGRLRRAKLA